MNERLLQYIWQFQYLNKNDLSTTDGQRLQIIDQGKLNADQGPDFINARVIVDTATWVGNIELHVRASDWRRHAHDTDPNYKNVILHVVWIDDSTELATRIPLLAINDRVPKMLLSRYAMWIASRSFLPCGGYLAGLKDIVWTNWKDRLLIERLERKYLKITAQLKITNDHWDEVLWWLIARSFGLRVNADVFEEIARSVPLNVVRRHRTQPFVLKGILLGQAGLLDAVYSGSEYPALKREYAFYRKKYGLTPALTPVYFLRMRPAYFPDKKLMQLAIFIAGQQVTFGDILQSDFRVLKSAFPLPVMINAVMPLLYSYGRARSDHHQLLRVLEIGRSLQSEQNAITASFLKHGLNIANAGESQAVIELKTMYCDQRRCLQCAVGNAILKRELIQTADR